jgi:NDP-sugar pyrophosphorylase family protein
MKAMVLCAGYGTRLGNLTRDIPKPMLLLNGKPMVEYIFANLKRHGINQIAVNLHFMPQAIQEHFGDGSHWGLHISYSREETLLGTAGGIKRMEHFLSESPAFLVHYGDVLTNQDFSAMLEFHQKSKALATLLLHQRARSNSRVLMDKDNRIIQFMERPTDAHETAGGAWVNSGICVCSPAIFSLIPAGRPCDLPRDIFQTIIPEHPVYGFPLSGYRAAIDSPERLEEAASAIAKAGGLPCLGE